MRGFGNHGLLQTGEFVSEGQASGLQLYNLGYFPGAIHGEGTIQGEVYEVDGATLGRLDRLEGHPTFYERQEKEVYLSSLNAKTKCYIYIYQDKPPEECRVESGSWREEYGL